MMASSSLQAISLLLFAFLHLCGSRTTSSFVPSRPVCPGEQLQFNCTVVDDGVGLHGYTFWRVNNSAVKEICFLSHYLGRDMDQCDPFTAELHGLQSNCYFSTLTANAGIDLNNSLVQCFGPNQDDLVGGDTLQVIGPPSSPVLKLPEEWITETENPDAYNVTVQWDLPGGTENFISQYVVTVAPELPPCGGGRCVVTAGMREFALRELTLTMGVSQKFNVTIRSDNCNNTHIGKTSNSFPIILHEPGVSSTCISCAVYNYSSNRLLSIDSRWSVVPTAIDMVPGLNASVRGYEITFQNDDGHIVTERVQSSTGCTERTCTHNFIPWSTNSSIYHISVAARNVVTLGQQQTCTPKFLSVTNNMMQVEVLESGDDVMIEGRILAAFTNKVYFEAWYGTDPSHHFLPYHDISDNAGNNGDVVTIQLSHTLQHNTTYYYNFSLSAANESTCSKVLYSSRIDCDPAELGKPLLSSDTTCRRAEGALRTDHGTVCYTGRMRGALAYYVCDARHRLAVGEHGRSATPLRVCLENGSWNGTTPTCVSLEGETTAAGVGSTSAIAVVSFAVGILCTTVVSCCIVMLWRRKMQKSKNCYSNPPPFPPPLPLRLQHHQLKGEVNYEEVSAVVADGGSCKMEMKTNVAYGPVQQKT